MPTIEELRAKREEHVSRRRRRKRKPEPVSRSVFGTCGRCAGNLTSFDGENSECGACRYTFNREEYERGLR